MRRRAVRCGRRQVAARLCVDALAQDGRYDEALATLDLLQNPNTAEALNYRGYATRKLGRVDEGIGYYLQSVALDPDYTLVREYLGEAYVIKGDLTGAKAAAERDRKALRHDLRALSGSRRGDSETLPSELQRDIASAHSERHLIDEPAATPPAHRFRMQSFVRHSRRIIYAVARAGAVRAPTRSRASAPATIRCRAPQSDVR